MLTMHCLMNNHCEPFVYCHNRRKKLYRRILQVLVFVLTLIILLRSRGKLKISSLTARGKLQKLLVTPL